MYSLISLTSHILQLFLSQVSNRAGDTGGGSMPPPLPLPPTFLCSKKKKGRQRQKRKGFKAETIKRLSPKSKYCCFSHSRASRIRKFFLSANHLFAISMRYITIDVARWWEKHLSKCSLMKGTLLDLREVLTIKSPLKMAKNVFYFMVWALFVLEIFTFLSWVFGYVEKRLAKKQ